MKLSLTPSTTTRQAQTAGQPRPAVCAFNNTNGPGPRKEPDHARPQEAVNLWWIQHPTSPPSMPYRFTPHPTTQNGGHKADESRSKLTHIKGALALCSAVFATGDILGWKPFMTLNARPEPNLS
ncbi:hypothetical protein CRENBAI_017920 [Crenichthys baileyi]|uniref:Uncharacterized protein n=1 Tax=Crenichthys baileyi TaxID=28760 RepID=A0AAV9SJW9_9TELE